MGISRQWGVSGIMPTWNAKDIQGEVRSAKRDPDGWISWGIALPKTTPGTKFGVYPTEQCLREFKEKDHQ
jgi:hypothetical protein